MEGVQVELEIIDRRSNLITQELMSKGSDTDIYYQDSMGKKRSGHSKAIGKHRGEKSD